MLAILENLNTMPSQFFYQPLLIFLILLAGTVQSEPYRRGNPFEVLDSMEVEKRELVKNAFLSMDIDNSWYITKDEFLAKKQLIKDKIDALIVRTDLDSDDRISFEEFVKSNKLFLEELKIVLDHDALDAQEATAFDWSFIGEYAMIIGIIGIIILFASFRFI